METEDKCLCRRGFAEECGYVRKSTERDHTELSLGGWVRIPERCFLAGAYYGELVIHVSMIVWTGNLN